MVVVERLDLGVKPLEVVRHVVVVCDLYAARRTSHRTVAACSDCCARATPITACRSIRCFDFRRLMFSAKHETNTISFKKNPRDQMNHLLAAPHQYFQVVFSLGFLVELVHLVAGNVNVRIALGVVRLKICRRSRSLTHFRVVVCLSASTFHFGLALAGPPTPLGRPMFPKLPNSVQSLPVHSDLQRRPMTNGPTFGITSAYHFGPENHHIFT